MLASIQKGGTPPQGIAQQPTVHKWYAYISGVTDQMHVTEGPTKPTKLHIAVTPDMLTLQKPFKPSPIMDASAFTSD